MQRRTGKAAAVMTGALLIGVIGTPAAHAEGKKTSYIKHWAPLRESSRWSDHNLDSVKTSVTLSGCSTDGSRFEWARLTLYRYALGPDTKIKSISKKCGTYSFGRVSAGTYYFTLDGFGSGGLFWAKKVVIRW
ncbi:hypothetical protein [Streptomyces sp. NRRL S-31]|uniref:hypothetical protein n=1 Tax=Streptomyces sp. NRRL S-31 TaxID=1463898 RepID=UPI0004CB34EC|nr:hypothetical protein [Streptomyces sp. NRRL S-31]